MKLYLFKKELSNHFTHQLYSLRFQKAIQYVETLLNNHFTLIAPAGIVTTISILSFKLYS